MLAALIAALLQQTAPAVTDQVVWQEPPTPEAAAPTATPPPIPESARTDPFGYERAQCSPMIRSREESLEACQARVRSLLAAHLGDDLPAGLRPGPTVDDCRQEAPGERYAVQCGPPSRPSRPSTVLEERVCETRPQAQPGGGVAWAEECRPASRRDEREGLTIRLGGD